MPFSSLRTFFLPFFISSLSFSSLCSHALSPNTSKLFSSDKSYIQTLMGDFRVLLSLDRYLLIQQMLPKSLSFQKNQAQLKVQILHELCSQFNLDNHREQVDSLLWRLQWDQPLQAEWELYLNSARAKISPSELDFARLFWIHQKMAAGLLVTPEQYTTEFRHVVSEAISKGDFSYYFECAQTNLLNKIHEAKTFSPKLREAVTNALLKFVYEIEFQDYHFLDPNHAKVSSETWEGFPVCLNELHHAKGYRLWSPPPSPEKIVTYEELKNKWGQYLQHNPIPDLVPKEAFEAGMALLYVSEGKVLKTSPSFLDVGSWPHHEIGVLNVGDGDPYIFLPNPISYGDLSAQHFVLSSLRKIPQTLSPDSIEYQFRQLQNPSMQEYGVGYNSPKGGGASVEERRHFHYYRLSLPIYALNLENCRERFSLEDGKLNVGIHQGFPALLSSIVWETEGEETLPLLCQTVSDFTQFLDKSNEAYNLHWVLDKTPNSITRFRLHVVPRSSQSQLFGNGMGCTESGGRYLLHSSIYVAPDTIDGVSLDPSLKPFAGRLYLALKGFGGWAGKSKNLETRLAALKKTIEKMARSPKNPHYFFWEPLLKLSEKEKEDTLQYTGAFTKRLLDSGLSWSDLYSGISFTDLRKASLLDESKRSALMDDLAQSGVSMGHAKEYLNDFLKKTSLLKHSTTRIQNVSP